MYTSINIDMGGTTLVEEPLILSSKRCADGNGTLSYLFFSDEWVDIQRAKAICSKCADQATCLSGALEREEPWGGLGWRRARHGSHCGGSPATRQTSRKGKTCHSHSRGTDSPAPRSLST